MNNFVEWKARKADIADGPLPPGTWIVGIGAECRDHIALVASETLAKEICDEHNRPRIDIKKRAYIVYGPGYWARGKTALAAYQQLKKMGCRNDCHTILVLVLGDDAPEINDGGGLVSNHGSEAITIIKMQKLGYMLTTLRDAEKKCKT